jgi:hypothetical protein
MPNTGSQYTTLADVFESFPTDEFRATGADEFAAPSRHAIVEDINKPADRIAFRRFCRTVRRTQDGQRV